MLHGGTVPKAVNHFRIGESLFLGTDLINGGSLAGLRDDVVLVEAEIAEIKEKSLVPLCETTEMSPSVTAGLRDLLRARLALAPDRETSVSQIYPSVQFLRRIWV
jgi:predicted amino acid racemase